VVYFIGNTVFLVFGSTQEQKWNSGGGERLREGVQYEALGSSDVEDDILPE
jgi:hypothetical protein